MTDEAPTLGSLWNAARRRWVVVLIPLVLVPAAVFGLSETQTPRYRATAEVLLQRQDLTNALLGTPNSSFGDDQRYAETQARIAVTPEVARRTLSSVDRDGMSTEQFLAELSVTPGANSDVLEVSVTDTDPALAALLATTHANQYVAYLEETETEAIRGAQKAIARQLRDLEKRDRTTTSLYESLQDKSGQLAAIEALRTPRASVIKSAEGAVQTFPRTVRNVSLGAVLGALIGVAIAFLLEALDTRIRRGDEVARRLDTPLLGHVSEPPRRLRRRNQLVMIADPLSQQAEAFRLLRTNVEFARSGLNGRIIEVTSAHEGEGKTTTVANLAVALAHGGQDVVLVDLDLRRPGVDRMFALPRGSGGVTGIALGQLPLHEALIPVDVSYGQGPTGDSGLRGHEPTGSLRVLPAGIIPPNPGDLVRSSAIEVILNSLAEDTDTVLVDAPPLLSVGDAMALTSFVDGMLLVLRVSDLRRGPLAELCRLTQRMPAELLGLVVTGAGDEGMRYGYYGEARTATTAY